jgi:hypothetical protein
VASTTWKTRLGWAFASAALLVVVFLSVLSSGFVLFLFVPSLIGAFWKYTPEVSVLRRVLVAVGVTGLLCVSLWIGGIVINRWFSTGGSSDILPGVMGLAYFVFCVVVADPLAWLLVTPRRWKSLFYLSCRGSKPVEPTSIEPFFFE